MQQFRYIWQQDRVEQLCRMVRLWTGSSDRSYRRSVGGDRDVPALWFVVPRPAVQQQPASVLHVRATRRPLQRHVRHPARIQRPVRHRHLLERHRTVRASVLTSSACIIQIPELLLVKIFSLFTLSNYGINCQKWYQLASSVSAFISRLNLIHLSFLM